MTIYTRIGPGVSTESFASRFEESLTKQDMRAGKVISVEVVRVDHNFVVVNAGFKSESYVPLEEFLNDAGEVEVQAGDFVSVAIEAMENGYGDTILSRDKAKRLASRLSLEKALDNNELVTGTITGRVKGGMTVMVNGIRAFLPGSLVDTRPVKDTTPYEGKTLEFRVIKLDRKRNHVVLSRRAVIESTQGEERAKLLETLKEGAIVEGVVKNITDYGAFVDLGGIDGLLHITDIAWRRVRHPSEVLSVGQEVTAKILKFDQEKNRVSLGIKQLGDDPWEGISRRYPSGTRLFGKVTNITDYGAFVEVESGIEGLVHGSEMDWANKNVAPSKVVQLGDEVEVMVLEIDEDRRRISLGMKQCKPNPWDDFSRNFKKGDKLEGAIKSVTDFGVFIGLPGGIDGLVHLSDLSWSETGEEAVRKYKKGDEVEAIVLGIDVEKERISLGMSQSSLQTGSKSEYRRGKVSARHSEQGYAPDAPSLDASSKIWRTTGVEIRATGCAIDVSDLRTLLAKYGSSFAGRVCTTGLSVVLRTDPCSTLDDFVDRLGEVACAYWEMPWAYESEVRPMVGVLGIYASGAIRSVGEIISQSPNGVRVKIKDGLELIDPDADQADDAYTEVVESQVTLVGVESL